jgi:hypothetical protein
MKKSNALSAAISVSLLVLLSRGSAQTPFDAEARASLANEINQDYGITASPSLPIAALFDLKNRLDEADNIARKYGVDLDYRQHTFVELCDIESRIELARAINRQYGRNLDWAQYGYQELLQIDQQLKSMVQAAKN